jgi:polyhydroxyalkanoate synthase
MRRVPTFLKDEPLIRPPARRHGPAMRSERGVIGIFPPTDVYEHVDDLRRWQGRWLDWIGAGLVETPSRVIFSESGVRLHAYQESDPRGPVLVIVPAPIKRAYIWDLAPWASVILRCLRNGMRVFLIEWSRPGVDEQGFGLIDYADRLIRDCLDVVARRTGEPCACLAGHSIGGTLAAIFASLRPERIQALVLIEAPLHFGGDAGAFAALVAVAPHIGTLTSRLGNVPGCFLDFVSASADPLTFQWSRWVDALESLWEGRALQTHIRVERWTLDEFPFPSRLFEEIVEFLYREDRFMAGTLQVGIKCAAPRGLAMPIAAVVDPRSSIVPPCAVLPFLARVPSGDKKLLWYQGDKGVALQHVGALVGQSAHRRLWPEILGWLHGVTKRPTARHVRRRPTRQQKE